MGRLFLVQLDGRTYSCKYCHSHLALVDELISKSFHCKNGRAYLFNTVGGALKTIILKTVCKCICWASRRQNDDNWNAHSSRYFCNCCGQIVGWKYEAAHEKSQKYKEGKFILERARMVDGDGRNFLVDTHVVGSDADDM